MILGGRQAGERNNLQPGDAYLLGNSGFPYLAARISSAAAGASAIAARGRRRGRKPTVLGWTKLLCRMDRKLER